MSGLAAVLAGRVTPAVYRWHAAYDVADVRHTVEHAGWAFAHLEGWRVESAAEFHQAVADALGFPDHYGHNLDALADCLSELEAPTVLVWDAWSTLARADGRTFDGALRVLGTRGRTLAVLLRGDDGEGADGLARAVPSLD